MKYRLFALILLLALLAGFNLPLPAQAQIETPFITPTLVPEPTAAPTQAPIITASVTPSTDSKTGLPGAVVSYSIKITNTGNLNLNVSTTVESLNGWAVSLEPSAFTLAESASQTVAVTVAIPVGASGGSMDRTTVRFWHNGLALGAAVLTTTVLVPTLEAFARPLIVMESYLAGDGTPILPGTQFDLRLRIANRGNTFARNIIFTFASGDFLPVNTGGVRTITEMDPGERLDVVQPLLASSALLYQTVATTTVNVTYTDLSGTPYSEVFTIVINLKQPYYSGASYATATPTLVSRPQLVVSNYTTDVNPLQPGTIFNLEIEVRNLGTSDARAVTMVLGGGVSSIDGTPQAGASGGGADLSTFAPLGSSNLVYLGEIPTGQTVKTTQQLIVNVSATPGAYAFKLAFVYDDAKGNRQTNDQVITMLIYQLPQLEISFYRDPGQFFLGQFSTLPLQITNLGRKTHVLGNMKVTAQTADVTNNVMLVGALDPGGYFTLDANVVPFEPGPLELEITVSYTDDFNQPRIISQTLVIEVIDIPTPEVPSEGEFPPDGYQPVEPETLWQKIVRFFKGLFGLDSAPPSEEQILPPEELFPEDGKPMEPEPIIVPVPKG